MSWSNNRQTQPETDRKFPRRVERVTAFVRGKYRRLRNAEKLLARASGATPRAARNWLGGQCTPRLEYILELAANDPEFRQALIDEIERCAR